MRLLPLLLLPIGFAQAQPVYTPESITQSGVNKRGPLAPGMLVSLYGTGLGPAQPCHAATESASLCDTEVRVAGRAAGLLYVSSGQVNFRVPKQLPVPGTKQIQVIYKARSGPLAPLEFVASQALPPVEVLAQRIWTGLHEVRWNAIYPGACKPVRPHTDLRNGLYGYAYFCSLTRQDIVTESFYFPTGIEQPAVLLQRADFRLPIADLEINAALENALQKRLTSAYGKPSVPDGSYEIGATKPSPGLSWTAGDVTIFLHRNRKYVEPGGIREGVQLIAIRREALAAREENRRIAEAFGSSAKLSSPVLAEDLRRELGASYLMPRKRASSEPERINTERQTRIALLHLLRNQKAGNPNKQAAILVAADDLTVRLGALLVSNAVPVRHQLAAYGVKYTGLGHYSGELEYDSSLLHRAANEYLDTPWGQRALLLLQRLSCSISPSGCKGPECFREVIRQGEKLLAVHPDSPFRKEQLYHLALANETWWSLSRAANGDPSAEGARIEKGSGELARRRAIELYEELARLFPDTTEALSSRARLPRLKLGLDTAERSFFCFAC